MLLCYGTKSRYLSRQMDFHKMRYVNKIKHCFFACLILSIGFFIGKGIGNLMDKKMMTGESFLSILFKMPSGRFMDVSQAISSENALSRVTGYCGMIEMGLATPDFLIDRYKKETDIEVKKIIAMLVKKYYPGKYHILEKNDPQLHKKAKSREIKQQEFLL
jgi:hypothetical protein